MEPTRTASDIEQAIKQALADMAAYRTAPCTLTSREIQGAITACEKIGEILGIPFDVPTLNDVFGTFTD